MLNSINIVSLVHHLVWAFDNDINKLNTCRVHLLFRRNTKIRFQL